MKIRSGKLDRIPPNYSDELMHFISAMLMQDPEKRPSTETLLTHEYVSIRIQERKQVDKYIRLKRKEADLNQKIESIKKKDEALEIKLIELAEKEAQLQKQALMLDQQELELNN